MSLASLEDVAKLDTRGGEEVLHEVSFRAEPGQMVALVGTSGAGKSTIASLLPRLYDVEAGAVRLGGVDVRDLSAADIRATLGMVTQDGHLFHDTIRANLLLAKPEADEDELWDVLRRARLADLVGSLPDGLDTVVGERGYRLSGGERQRLTIAVRPSSASSSASWTATSLVASRWAVASSSSTTRGRASSSRAMVSRCRSPPENR